MPNGPTIAVLGASGLIGEAVSRGLTAQGFTVVPIARRFTGSQRAAFGSQAVECGIIGLNVSDLAHLLSDVGADVVVNCIGILRDGSRGSTDDVHEGFVKRLLDAMAMRGSGALLMHISIPGKDADDATPFSRTKREAERAIAASPIASVILRLGFVIAPAAYGGSALMRAMAMTSFGFPPKDASRPFMITAAQDIERTIAFIARQRESGHRNWKCVWDVMAPPPLSIGDVLNAFRKHFGGPRVRLPLPPATVTLGSWMGDLAAWLGWSPPLGRTSLSELRRGIEGDPMAWMSATGIVPVTLEDALDAIQPTVQEKWFARLYFLKPLIVAILVVFWCASGLIALTAAFDAATAILTAHGFPLSLGRAVTIASSCTDIAIGVMIAFRKTCRIGLLAGIAVSLFYMVSAAFITPEMWFEPLGALVKTFPSIVLSLVLLAILEDR